MSKSSIHIKKAAAGILLHNSRDNYSKSVVFTDEENEISTDSKNAFKLYRQELNKRSKKYTERTKQKLQKNAITHLSAVINLEQHHNLEDLEEIKNYLEQELDTKVFQMSIHRDEGKLILKENEEINLVSGETFFKNPKDDLLYHDKDFTELIDLDDYIIEKNYHAHIEMMGLDSTGAGIKRKYMNTYRLSKLQDYVAKSLNMERGINYRKENIKAPKRLEVLELKKKSVNENKLKVQELAKQKDLKQKIQELRAELKENSATREEYSKLEQLNRELKEKIKQKELTAEQLLKEVEHFKSLVELKKTELEDSLNQNKSLEEQKKVLDDKLLDLEEKINSRADMEEYKSQHEFRNEMISKFIAENEVQVKKPNLGNLFTWIKEKFVELSQKITSLTNELKSKEQEISNLKSENQNLIKENLSLKNEINLKKEINLKEQEDLAKLISEHGQDEEQIKTSDLSR